MEYALYILIVTYIIQLKMFHSILFLFFFCDNFTRNSYEQSRRESIMTTSHISMEDKVYRIYSQILSLFIFEISVSLISVDFLLYCISYDSKVCFDKNSYCSFLLICICIWIISCVTNRISNFQNTCRTYGQNQFLMKPYAHVDSSCG